MRNLHQCAKEFCMLGLLAVLALIACLSTAAQNANIIKGSVQNQSRGEPAVGADVLLVRLDRQMQEEARAKTDAHGTFTLNVQYPGKPYLVRVLHQGVSYDQQASPGDALSIQVFDAARRVRGITGTIEILRTGTNGNLLHVSDLVEIKNESSPPLTQAGERTFEMYLPANARIDSVLAAGPGKMGMTISAAQVPGEPGHYTVSFPLRPGATKFAFNYDLPYGGHVAFHTRRAYPLRQLAVMIPPTMKFSATGNNRYQVQAINQLQAGEGPDFEIFGTGAVPPLADQAKTPARPSPAVANPVESAPGRFALPHLATVDPRLKPAQPPSQSPVLLGMTSVLVVVCALLIWRARKAQSISAAQTVAARTRQRQNSTT